MGCFPCAGKSLTEKPYKKRRNNSGNNRCGRDDDHVQRPPEFSKVSRHRLDNSKAMISSQTALLDNPADEACRGVNPGTDLVNRAKRFTYAEMVAATQDFKDEYFLGEGGFGKVYKGLLPNSEQIVAIKQLDRDGCQGTKEFGVEVSTLGKADHPNLVKLYGYCDERDQSLLVYEFMPFGSLEDHLHGPFEKSQALDWNTRMKIVAGAAMGLEYLHNKMNPPVIYRDLKCSNILLGEGYHPKLSDFGLAKDGPSGDRTHVSTRVMGTYGYCAPDYAMTGQLNFKSDIYSFGVVLLEIVTGRKAIDYKRTGGEQTLVEWAKPMFKDRKKFHKMVDPALEGQYPVRGLYQALAIAAMCTQEQPSLRPLISDVVSALNFLASQRYVPKIHPVHSPRTLHSPGTPQSPNTPQFPGMDRNKDTSEE